ncbi:hypothetical protein Cgig2_009028 [Carnegiea gigantea]|uniref:Uncharacterized protein n=1 Tax=Carnegiea gigantea TaxID=171969 RepID=A0A9Q1KFD8_9CARY|nr:hypothetical protein Cgig2_009028 [Carnegiea gigantea]
MPTHTPHPGPIFRAEPANYYNELQSSSYVEKRQLFLRSYQFSRKQSLGERMRKSFVKLKQSLWVRLRSAKRVRRFVWAGLRSALYNKRRRLAKIVNYHFGGSCNGEKFYEYELFYASPCPSSCLWSKLNMTDTFEKARVWRRRWGSRCKDSFPQGAILLPPNGLEFARRNLVIDSQENGLGLGQRTRSSSLGRTRSISPRLGPSNLLDLTQNPGAGLIQDREWVPVPDQVP